MSALFAKWKTVYTVLIVLLVSTFALSSIGNTGTDAQNDSDPNNWIGSLFWVAFGLTLLVTIAYTVGLLVSRMRGRSAVARG